MVGFIGVLEYVIEGNTLIFCVDVAGASRSNCVVNFPFNVSVTTLPGGSAGSYILCIRSWFAHRMVGTMRSTNFFV